MSYCLNPACTNPNNLPQQSHCQACGSPLLIRERYRADRILGRGGFATTFLAKDESLPGEPICVIKQLRPVLTAAHIIEMSRELFQREATTLGKIGNHPQLPRLLDFFELQNDFYLVQEYVSGRTLQQEVRRLGPFMEDQVHVVLHELLPILDYLHQQQVIHRDIKPANIIRREIDNKLVLIDFGAVKDQVTQTAMMNAPEATTFTNFAVGTPGFAPPEQMAMRPVYASDVYSLGVTCLYLLTGKSPKDLNYNPTTGELSWQHLVQISPSFGSVLKNMLAVSLRDRYQLPKDVLRAMEQLKQSAATPIIPALPARTPPPITLPRKQNPNREQTTGTSRRTPSGRVARRTPDAEPFSEGLTKISGDSKSPPREQRYPRNRQPEPVPSFERVSEPTVTRRKNRKLTAAGLLQAYDRGARDFSNSDLSQVKLRKAQLPDINFHEAKLQQADFRGANLYNAKLGRVTLTGANLSNACLSHSYLSYADLEGADLRGADLTNAHLSNANLRGANLGGADLTNATLSQGQLAFAQCNWLTVMPNGKRGKQGKRGLR